MQHTRMSPSLHSFEFLIFNSCVFLFPFIMLKWHRLYFDGSGSFDWTKDPNYDCTTTDTSISCMWYDSLALLQPGIPYDIPKVVTSLTDVPPTQAKTVRVNSKWVSAT